jgi:hypothetical protein
MKIITQSMFTIIILLIISCKKESTEITDNPNIIHRVINKELIAKSDLTTDYSEFDIDNNGVNDFVIELHLQKFAQNVRLLGIPIGNVSLAMTTSSEDPYIVKNLVSKSVINTTSKDWSQLSFLSIFNNEFTANVVDEGYAGKGDVVIGVQFLIDGNIHFGWIVVNISSTRKYIIVKEVAYDIRANTEILAGEK